MLEVLQLNMIHVCIYTMCVTGTLGYDGDDDDDDDDDYVYNIIHA